MKCDVLLIADVVERNWNSSLKYYGLGIKSLLEWNSFKLGSSACMTKVEVELISDVDMHSFFKKGMRGIVSYISKRYSIVNYKYDPKQESKHLINLNTKNLLTVRCQNFFQQMD